VTAILRANLEAITRRDSDLAQRIQDADPAPLTWGESKAGPLVASLEIDGKHITLASRYDPLAEADNLLGDIDYDDCACVVILGMALGYHAQRVANTIGSGITIVYEPDVAMLRAVLERIDHSDWLGRDTVILADAAFDQPMLTGRLEKFAGLVTQGTKIITHPPSRIRCGRSLNDFSQIVTNTLAYCRTNVATALVNSSRTCSNLAGNLAHYVAGATTDALHRAAEGYPAVCVAAGPSLVKNVDLLCDPKVRKNIVVIAAQTTLKPLLDRGIKPDFVTALDYSHISARFYENLADLPDVTLVAEPKVHPAVIDAFPGPIRMTSNKFADEVAGSLAPPRIALKPGTTVAHLSMYLAEHLGCDPIIMIGQDLGFCNGLYYAPGTAIHQVWSSELNPMNSIEMMEWSRIARHKAHLRKFEDIHGQPMYSDEQMITYLRQFERDFAEATATILDATEGGMPKAQAQIITLAEALTLHATRSVPQLPVPDRLLDHQRLEQLCELMQQRVGQINDLRSTSKQTIPILKQMQQHQNDRARMDKLFKDLHKNQRHVEVDLAKVFSLVNQLNVIGAFKRIRSDRKIAYQTDGGIDRQTRQIERDIENIEILIQATDEALRIFDDARLRIDTTIAQQHELQPA